MRRSPPCSISHPSLLAASPAPEAADVDHEGDEAPLYASAPAEESSPTRPPVHNPPRQKYSGAGEGAGSLEFFKTTDKRGDPTALNRYGNHPAPILLAFSVS